MGEAGGEGVAAGMSEGLEKAERDLERARHILSHSVQNLQPEDWMLVATLVGEADLVFQATRRHNPHLEWPLLEAAVDELREATSGFTNPKFLRSTRAARRRNPKLFR